MIRFLADENFNNDIVRGLLRRKADLDVVRVGSVELTMRPARRRRRRL
jgi:hypothetical protein